ncbi:uncharacterized protein LOC129582203 [Paramacrobiotus metropolitanus]|uniref:uncharacterized protein LOC129582203 n=1 Tax=Paramacrobiotus metropolitanus TaxID=2943436 RepID=UPI0024462289|nr:uncharacterized protein LOC129582203 [Paramacrobiotus metropolitanus]
MYGGKKGMICSLLLLCLSITCFYAQPNYTLNDASSRQSVGEPERAGQVAANASRNVPAPVDCWPNARFALLRPVTDCPGGGIWEAGEVMHHLGGSSSVSQQNLLGAHITEEAVTLHFCVRNPSDEPWYDDCRPLNPAFPPGSYCLLNAQPRTSFDHCPAGFHWSVVGLDDVGTPLRRARPRGFLPTGEYLPDFTRYYFCCRNDSAPGNPVVLPTQRPFILFPLGGHCACQEVVGMRARMVSLYLDAENGSYVNHPDPYCSPYAETADSIVAGAGSACIREKRGTGLRLHMCHYS